MRINNWGGGGNKTTEATASKVNGPRLNAEK